MVFSSVNGEPGTVMIAKSRAKEGHRVWERITLIYRSNEKFCTRKQLLPYRNIYIFANFPYT